MDKKDLPLICQTCKKLGIKEKYFCHEEYWDNYLGMNGKPVTAEIADNCRFNNVEHLTNISVESCNTQIKMAKLQKKNILENSDQLTQAYYKIDNFIKEKDYSHWVRDILKFHSDYLDQGQYPSGSVKDIANHCRRSIEKLYNAGYRG